MRDEHTGELKRGQAGCWVRWDWELGLRLALGLRSDDQITPFRGAAAAIVWSLSGYPPASGYMLPLGPRMPAVAAPLCLRDGDMTATRPILPSHIQPGMYCRQDRQYRQAGKWTGCRHTAASGSTLSGHPSSAHATPIRYPRREPTTINQPISHSPSAIRQQPIAAARDCAHHKAFCEASAALLATRPSRALLCSSPCSSQLPAAPSCHAPSDAWNGSVGHAAGLQRRQATAHTHPQTHLR